MREVKLSIGRITRSNECDNWRKIDSLDVSIWANAINLLSKRQYSHQGCQAVVTADWSPVYHHISDHAERNVEFHELLANKGDLTAWFKNNESNFSKDLTVICTVEFDGRNKLIEHPWYPEFFAERYIYDFFTVMNFSVPGSCDFLNIRVLSDRPLGQENRKELSSFNFEDGLSSSFMGATPKLDILQLKIVYEWYNKLNIGVKQKAETPIEKALFSLLHICKLDGEVTSVIWIFHALESLYSTRVGEGFTNLFNRISMLLELNKKEQSILKKNLRKLYDFRSSIVHGGYEVHHPERSEAIDSRINDDMSSFYKLNQYEFNIVVCSIQQLIKNNWHGIKLDESMSGVMLP